MACSIRMSHSFITSRIIQRSRYLPSAIFDNRYFCSKDGDVKETSATSEDPPKETDTERKSLNVQKKKPKMTPPTEEMKAAAKEKLKSLLLEISVKPDSATESKSALNLAKAAKRISKKERLKQLQDKLVTPEKEMKMAVQAIASSFKSNAEKVESEITDKLEALNLTKKTSTEEEPEAPKKAEMPLIDNELNTTLMSSVEEVAATISEQPIPSRSELTQRLMKLSLNQKIKSDKTMKSVIQGMVIKSRRSAALDRKQAEIRASERIKTQRIPSVKKFERVNIFGGTPLNIFAPDVEPKPESSNTFWQKLEKKELRLITQFAPANAFEEMIMWTEQGKHWKLPIDNEIEMGAEEEVGFHEHVFLERHLEGFPTKGPIRHFMELVCVGLSKNPYLTVERKVANIEWFRNYFKDKEELLKETGAIE